MSTQGHGQTLDGVILGLAAQQHGVVGRRQLLEAGATRDQIAHRVRTGRLRQLHRGVYLVGAIPPPLALETAALLASGPGAVLGHQSAAALWNLRPHPASTVTVTVPPGRTPTRPRIQIHRAALDRKDIRRRHGLPLTSPPRTVLDLATELKADDLEQLVAEAHYRRLASESELRDQLHRNPGKRGAARMRAVLDLPGGSHRIRSPAERRLINLLRRARIADFETNTRIHGYEVDFLWRDRNVVVEVDGYDAHSGRAAFERDRLKWATLIANGVSVIPVTGRQIRDDPEGVIRRILDSLAAGAR